MGKVLTLPERLIVAADFEPHFDVAQLPSDEIGRDGVEKKLMALAENLRGTGVIIKVNSALRALGLDLIDRLHDMGLKVFADFKLCDIPNTMKADAMLLSENVDSLYQPELLTVMTCAGIDGMRVVQQQLPDTEVLGVTVLTSLNEEECQAIFGCSTKAGVLRFARMAQLAGLKGLILSPQEAELIKTRPELAGLSINTPGVRFADAVVKGDDQKRVLTPELAMLGGADRIVMGRPITGASDPRAAVQRALGEIQAGLDKLAAAS